MKLFYLNFIENLLFQTNVTIKNSARKKKNMLETFCIINFFLEKLAFIVIPYDYQPLDFDVELEGGISSSFKSEKSE
ncbi:hypothetical protein BpHYR1_028293 [Brachionus plicatilis]|uniref:Uncharacterized protein n=1 Tax=Brachionus plicatilis TaxID=10195 RepID=A0A3M7R9Q8_BRAPC|nr:hypothetical protein BpHYR1_028293 [Brachionus plicatilis]